ncbi:MAG: excinuclease ABC subunit UvrB, partial [Candidatus Methanofastidiosia archaeon]
MPSFKLRSSFKPRGDQPKAIKKLSEGLQKGLKHQVLLGVTGSGKTFTIANVIQKVQKPTLVISPNKTLAAQLFTEFKAFFPENAAEYFVSYYDYYQPEAYIPKTDLYIAKETSVNEEIEKMKLSATSSLVARRDVIIVASVSCIYGLGSPEDYSGLTLRLFEGQRIEREKILKKLVEIQYQRNDSDLWRGRFRVRGDVIEVHPSYGDTPVRIELFEDEVERISEIHPVTGERISKMSHIHIYPAKHYVSPEERTKRAIDAIRRELEVRYRYFKENGKLLEAQRLEQRTKYDLEMLKEIGYCTGIENYSLHFDGRNVGDPPYTLLDYFPKDYLVIIDESHVTIPQIGSMYEGDYSRKKSLVKYGFRLPSAFDNRPLKFSEFEGRVNQIIYVSATPGSYEIKRCQNLVEQIIRPTGLVDPEVFIRPTENQIDNLVSEIRDREGRERVLVTTLTKRMAEDLADYLNDLEIKVRYLHSEIDTLNRVDIIRDLRLGVFDCLVGINLLREGLDLPEVSLVAILDADKEGFLRTETSLIQTFGRCARNVNGKVIMYADHISKAMEAAIRETIRRRRIQMEFNQRHGITPESIRHEVMARMSQKEKEEKLELKEEVPNIVEFLEREMLVAAKNLEFEKAAMFRDKIRELKGEV